MLDSLSFKLKSSKVLFIIGVWVTIVIVGFGVFTESKSDGNSIIQETQELFFGEEFLDKLKTMKFQRFF